MKRPMILALTALVLNTTVLPATAETALSQEAREHEVVRFNILIAGYNGANENLAKLRECDVDGVHNVDPKAEYHGTPGDHTFPVDGRLEGLTEVKSYDELSDEVRSLLASQNSTSVIEKYGDLRTGARRAYERCDAKRNGRKVKWPMSTFM